VRQTLAAGVEGVREFNARTDPRRSAARPDTDTCRMTSGNAARAAAGTAAP
jgi:hypothetical protein